MKKWICGTLETPFFWALTLVSILLGWEVFILAPWFLGFTFQESSVVMTILMAMVSAPIAIVLCMVRPDVGPKSNDMAFPSWIGRMYDKYYTTKSRIGYAILNLSVLVLIGTKVTKVFDPSALKLILATSFMFTIIAVVLSGTYYWALQENKIPNKS